MTFASDNTQYTHTLLLQDFISKLVVLDPNDRLSVKEALQHPWATGAAARMEPMPGVGKRLSEMLLKKRETVNLIFFPLVQTTLTRIAFNLLLSYNLIARGSEFENF